MLLHVSHHKTSARICQGLAADGLQSACTQPLSSAAGCAWLWRRQTRLSSRRHCAWQVRAHTLPELAVVHACMSCYCCLHGCYAAAPSRLHHSEGLLSPFYPHEGGKLVLEGHRLEEATVRLFVPSPDHQDAGALMGITTFPHPTLPVCMSSHHHPCFRHSPLASCSLRCRMYACMLHTGMGCLHFLQSRVLSPFCRALCTGGCRLEWA